MSRVFVSHVAEDSALAVRLARGLEDAGYATWYYERDSLPGASASTAVLTAAPPTAGGDRARRLAAYPPSTGWHGTC